jgi:hypothetical protein
MNTKINLENEYNSLKKLIQPQTDTMEELANELKKALEREKNIQKELSLHKMRESGLDHRLHDMEAVFYDGGSSSSAVGGGGGGGGGRSHRGNNVTSLPTAEYYSGTGHAEVAAAQSSSRGMTHRSDHTPSIHVSRRGSVIIQRQ